jgi:hypothetical protein
MKRIQQRHELVDKLVGFALRGASVSLLGPRGIGKTTLLLEVARIVGEIQGRPVGYGEHTASLGDVTRALCAAYPEVARDARTRPWLRGALRLAAEARPGVLLLDHVVGQGTALRGFLRSLEGTGLGLILAADVHDARERELYRRVRLASREVDVPPLSRRELRALLVKSLVATGVTLASGDAQRLLDLARGRPGFIVGLAARVGEPQYWRHGRLLAHLLCADLELMPAVTDDGRAQ